MKLPWVNFGDGLPRTGGYSRRRDPALGNPADRWGWNGIGWSV